MPSAGRRAVVASKRVVKTATLTEANVHVGEVAARSGSGEREWEFFCECGRPDCNALVTLTIEAYTDIRDAETAVLTPGHTLNPVVRAKRLREGAQAARLEVEFQTRRLSQKPS